MFGRDKKTQQPDSAPVTETVTTPVVESTPERPGRPAPKGRPTPKRRDQEAQRRTPLVPANREAAKRDAKQRSREERIAHREAVARGDESALLPRDRGPIKRFIRDSVDSRLTMGELVMPLVLIMLALSLLQNRTLQMVMLVVIWLIVVAGILDAVIRWQRIKRQIRDRFHTEPPKGCASYAIMRAFQMRMTRMPKPQVKRGAKV